MDWKLFATTFGLVFLAELGDKTQLAAIALSSRTPKPLSVFFGSWLALGVTSALGVLVGWAMGRVLSPKPVTIIAGVVFVAAGVWMIVGAVRGGR